MDSKVLVVFTGKSREQMMADGGTAHWVLHPAKVRGFEYVVCTRNSTPTYDPGPGDRSEPRGAAFLVAKIAGLEKTGTENGRDRYRVLFGDVGEVLVEGFWDGSRNPVRYMTIGDVGSRNLYFDEVNFKSYKRPVLGPETAPESRSEPLGIAAAKLGLAATFGVLPEAVEITIRG